MNQIISIRNNIISGQEVQTVNARELHAELGLSRDFNQWMREQIERVRLMEGRDWVSYEDVGNLGGGRPRKEYAITIEAAKHIAMMSGTDKGFDVREYFIECEHRANTAIKQLPDFTNPAAAARAWADEVEAKQTALAQLEAAKPAITFVDKYVDGTGLKTFREVCKLLQANEGRFREFLADNKVMYRLNGSWVPYQNHIEAGRLMVKTGISERNGHAFTEVKFTPKGVNWVAGEWGKHQIQSEVA